MDDHRKLAKGVWVNVLGLLTKTSRIAYLAVFSRMLGPEGFGLYMLSFSISEVISKFSAIGLEGGMLKLTGRYLALDQAAEVRWILHRVIWIGFFFSFAVTGLSWAIAPFIANDLINKAALTTPFRLFCLSIPWLCMSWIVLYSIRSTLDMKYENLIKSFIEPVVTLILGVISLSVFKMGVEGLAWAHLLASVIGFAVSLFFFYRLFPHSQRPDKVDWRDLFNTSIPMGGLSALGMFKVKVDLFFIGRFLPLSSVGIYSAIIEINQALSKMRSLFDPILVPMVQSFHEKIEKERMSQSLSLGLRWVSIPVLGVMGTMLLFPEAYLGFFGDNFETGIKALCIYAIGQVIASIFGVLENVLAVTGYAYSMFFQLSLMVSVNLVLLTFLVPKYGIEGAALVSTLYLIVINTWRIFFVKQKMQVWPIRKHLIKPFLAFLLSLGAFFLLKTFYQDRSFLIKIFAGVTYLITYVFLLFKMGLEDVDRDMLQSIVARVPFKKSRRQ